MTRRPPGQSERSRMRRRVLTFASIAKELRENWTTLRDNDYEHGWNDALEYAARLLEQRGRG